MKTPSFRVLAVDDDPEFLEYLDVGLRSRGIECAIAPDGVEALEHLSRGPAPFDLILLDGGMPRKNGWEMMDDLRRAGDEIPVIFVSANEKAEDRVRALRLGADDYLVKPFLFDELVARMDAVLRRRRAMPPARIGHLDLDLARRKVTRDGHRIELSPREFDLLHVLVNADGEVLSRKDLLRDVWDITFDPETNLLDVQLGRLRRKLDRYGRPSIQTVRGKGYRLATENLARE